MVMTDRDCGARRGAAAMALAGLAVGYTLLAAWPAGADPEPVAPGQPVVATDVPVAAPLPPGPPTVPEIANPVYGSGKYGSGPLGTLRDLWHQAHNPYWATEPDQASAGAPPPPGAGPAPPLPPGYVSLTAPGSETASTAAPPNSGGPPLPPGYYSITGPPPPGYEFAAPGAPATAPPSAPTP